MASASASPLTIIVDTREQRPPPWPEGVTTEVATLAEGDYTTPFLWDVARIERKSGSDWMGSISQGRERFFREIERLKAYPFRCIVVEAPLGFCREEGANYDLMGERRRTRSHMAFSSVVGTVASLYARHGCPTFFADDPATAGRLIAGILRRLEDCT